MSHRPAGGIGREDEFVARRPSPDPGHREGHARLLTIRGGPIAATLTSARSVYG